MPLRYIYWFAYFNDEEPSVRYRCKYILEELRSKHGIEYVIVYPGYSIKNILTFTKVFIAALLFRKRDSLIVFQKIRTNRVYANLLALLLFFRKNNTLYDIDDADYLKFSPHTIHHFMRHCSICSVGSSTLQTYAEQYNRNAFLLTSPVIDHRQIKERRNEKFTIGWIGYYNAHQNNLKELLFPALHKIDFEVDVVLLGITKHEHIEEVKNYFKNNENINVQMPLQINWQDENAVYEIIKTFDIGVAPLLNTEVNRAKSAFKLKQYLSCGIPVLASNIGENKTFLFEGSNGHFCDNADEYYSAIYKMNHLSDEQYIDMSNRARSTANMFSVPVFCSLLLYHYNMMNTASQLAAV